MSIVLTIKLRQRRCIQFSRSKSRTLREMKEFSRTPFKSFSSSSVLSESKFTLSRDVSSRSHCEMNIPLLFLSSYTSKTNANWYDTDRPVGLCTSGAMRQGKVCACVYACDRKRESLGGEDSAREKKHDDRYRKQEIDRTKRRNKIQEYRGKIKI